MSKQATEPFIWRMSLTLNGIVPIGERWAAGSAQC
jgi:hypothetical protein